MLTAGAARIFLSCLLHPHLPPFINTAAAATTTTTLSFPFSSTPQINPNPRPSRHVSFATSKPTLSDNPKTLLFIPPGIDPHEVTDQMILPSSNIVVGPYAGDSKIKQVEFMGSSARPKDCPKDDRPEFAMLGRSNVGKSSLINTLVRKKEVALTSKKPGFLSSFFSLDFDSLVKKISSLLCIYYSFQARHSLLIISW